MASLLKAEIGSGKDLQETYFSNLLHKKMLQCWNEFCRGLGISLCHLSFPGVFQNITECSENIYVQIRGQMVGQMASGYRITLFHAAIPPSVRI